MAAIEERIDVSEGVPLPGRHELAVSLFLPEVEPAAVLFCGHGGTYTRRYWDFALDGHPGYSFGRHLAADGFVVVAWDDLGTGESSCPDDPWSLTTVEVAAAGDRLVRTIVERLGVGALPSVGVGHSLGALLTIRRQARHRTHDALALLGWTNLGLRMTPGWWGERTPVLLEERRPGAGPAEAEQLLREIRDELVHVDPVAHRETLRPVFHWEDVPDEVVAADNALATVRNGPTAFVGQLPDIALEDAATLDVPLFLGFGERDVSPDPWAEPPVYRSARDVTFHVLPRSGHCHNFASTRVLQWERIASWVRSVTRTA